MEGPICLLNDDCMIGIFKYLPIVDRIRIERVSKRWKQQSICSWSCVKVLKYDSQFVGMKPSGKRHCLNKLKVKDFAKILRRCGKYLQTVDNTSNEDTCILSLIARYSPNIRVLRTFKVTASGLSSISLECSELREMSLLNLASEREIECQDYLRALADGSRECCSELDNILARIFSNNVHLRLVRLYEMHWLRGNCFVNLSSKQLQKISVDIQSEYTKELLKNLSKLISWNSSVVEVRAKIRCETSALTIIGDRHCKNTVSEIDVHYPHYIDRLDSKLSRAFVNNNFLRSFRLQETYLGIFNGDCLRHLRFDTLEEITIDSMNAEYEYDLERSLARCCPFLRTLGLSVSINNNPHVMASCISACFNLKILNLTFYTRYSEIFSSAISTSKTLEELTLCGIWEDKLDRNFFYSIRNGCVSASIRIISLSGFQEISEIGLECLSDITGLKELKLSWIRNFSGKSIKEFSDIERFSCVGCKYFSEEDAVKLIKNAKNLRLLELSFWGSVRDILVAAAIEETSHRLNGTVLEF